MTRRGGPLKTLWPAASMPIAALAPIARRLASFTPQPTGRAWIPTVTIAQAVGLSPQDVRLHRALWLAGWTKVPQRLIHGRRFRGWQQPITPADNGITKEQSP